MNEEGPPGWIERSPFKDVGNQPIRLMASKGFESIILDLQRTTPFKSSFSWKGMTFKSFD
ncbi:uncharacterized protein PGTG_22712 [Puccinia graminis f. sp. tritici CRL 75-36-700-3]|uniref:Uncharacterized protein n=1 Tax=Puccinia graminis f. sp. tritici (strain CRL 75-36-700-3 / race SCCL) TaxID=418459 RepID=H6QVH7_PUCGT|nr:uncharacterized protein PGTG_22712 [Puccinia graminis f. sp. tritici CRL 75-36-700-3]EHS62992.1 hypothetical protein PGTG_22712 [Puccinia graminis f. sp. tritici CRL 75-36-700-3]